MYFHTFLEGDVVTACCISYDARTATFQLQMSALFPRCAPLFGGRLEKFTENLRGTHELNWVHTCVNSGQGWVATSSWVHTCREAPHAHRRGTHVGGYKSVCNRIRMYGGALYIFGRMRTLFSRPVHCCEKALVTRLVPFGPRMVVNQRPKYWGAAPQCFGGVNGGMRRVQGGFCLTNAFST